MLSFLIVTIKVPVPLSAYYTPSTRPSAFHQGFANLLDPVSLPLNRKMGIGRQPPGIVANKIEKGMDSINCGAEYTVASNKFISILYTGVENFTHHTHTHLPMYR